MWTLCVHFGEKALLLSLSQNTVKHFGGRQIILLKGVIRTQFSEAVLWVNVALTLVDCGEKARVLIRKPWQISIEMSPNSPLIRRNRHQHPMGVLGLHEHTRVEPKEPRSYQHMWPVTSHSFCYCCKTRIDAPHQQFLNQMKVSLISRVRSLFPKWNKTRSTASPFTHHQ